MRSIFMLVLGLSVFVPAVRLAGVEVDSEARAEVLERVGDRPLYAVQVDRELEKVVAGRDVDPEVRERLRVEVRKQLVDRLYALNFVKSATGLPSDADVQLEVSRLTKQLQSRGSTIERYLESQSVALPVLEEEIRWRLAWKYLLDKYLTDANLAAYFASHRAEFDGRRVRVAHILWKVPAEDQAATAATREARQVLTRLQDDALTFEEAAEQYSEAPSGEQGGELGWITLREPMPEDFSRVAIGLDTGEVGGPVRTKFGVHLIRCLEVEPGQQTWQDAREDLSRVMAAELFRWAARQGRQASDQDEEESD